MYADKSDEYLIHQYRSCNNKCFDALLSKYHENKFPFFIAWSSEGKDDDGAFVFL